jgi:mannose-6-phosphate isomerase-like protein (cupin superfamily)
VGCGELDRPVVLEHRTLGGKRPVTMAKNQAPSAPIVARPGAPAISAIGSSLVVHEWTESGPSYLHIHRSDDEAWHVLEGSLRFRFADREVDAPVGTTVFVPAGTAHTYRVTAAPTRYLIFLTPRLDRLIARLHALSDPSELRATLAEFDTVLVE